VLTAGKVVPVVAINEAGITDGLVARFLLRSSQHRVTERVIMV
jgi:hypothetical protein